MAEKIRLILPPGRIVGGTPTFKQDRDLQGRFKDKPNWWMAVAIPNSSPGIDECCQQAINCAMGGYSAHPAIQQKIIAGLKGGFAFKIEDGDDPNDAKNRGREGYAGCWIWKLSTHLGVPPCIDQRNVPMDPAHIKCGYYVDVAISIECNGNTDHTAGIYVNQEMVRLLGFGPEIISGPTPEQVFGNRPAVLPAGASATPWSSGGFPSGGQQAQQAGFGGQPQQGFPAGGQAAPGGVAQGQPAPAPSAAPRLSQAASSPSDTST